MGKLIVVIEEDNDMLELFRCILSGQGYEVIEYHNLEGYEYLERLKTIIARQPSLIILENKSCDGYGYSVCLALKTNPAIKHIPIILVSSCFNLETIANRCHADAFLIKPFDLGHLTAMADNYTLGAYK